MNITKKQILEQCKKIEIEEDIKVLFLIESGSRAWRWESEDSDYDIRGVYIQDYNRFEKDKEQIDRKIEDLDITLWDLKKFLRLMIKSNPSVWEWLSSDIIYINNKIRKELKEIFNNSFSRYELKKHYISMAKQNFKKYVELIKNENEVSYKKYLYILRSIACVLWIEKYNSAPPKNYKEVIKLLPKKIIKFIENIVKDKVQSEKTIGKRNYDIEKYINDSFLLSFKQDKSNFDIDKLERIFKIAIINN
jgi:predicted nucleotidyltransferase